VWYFVGRICTYLADSEEHREHAYWWHLKKLSLLEKLLEFLEMPTI